MVRRWNVRGLFSDSLFRKAALSGLISSVSWTGVLLLFALLFGDLFWLIAALLGGVAAGVSASAVQYRTSKRQIGVPRKTGHKTEDRRR